MRTYFPLRVREGTIPGMHLSLHHAVIIDGDRQQALTQAREYVVATLGMPIPSNPDVSIVEYDRFGVDDVRLLKERAYQRAFGTRQVFVIAAYHLTREAQNGLLKLLEEPPQGTHLILIVPTIEHVLATIRSRVLHLGTAHAASLTHDRAERFMQASVAKRLTLVKGIIDKKDRADARVFLHELEAYVRTQGASGYSSLRDIVFVEQYVSDTSSSVKMLLEHLAVALPVPVRE